MLGKTEVKVSRPRGDGRHCDLCGCSFPAVRCDKCGSQIFCLSCDDMYHRHPKRRFHLRKAVDPTPTPQARPVLPMKVSQLASTPGDPSKMPLPPPRKKKPGKSFFDSFRRGSPSSDNSPPLPKKEYSWTDRLGSIKKFMSNRPLPPLPKDEDHLDQKSSPPLPRKNDLSFIHKRVDEKPPQLPHRMQAKSPSRKLSEGDSVAMNQENHLPADKQAEWTTGFGASANNFRQVPMVPATQHLNGQASRDSSERELSTGRFRSKSLQGDVSPTGMPNFAEPQNLSPTMPPDVRGYSTLKRPSTHGQGVHNQSFMSMPGDSFPGMQSSSSVTDLHSLDSPPVRGPQQFPNFPMPPHYPHPYPMYPHYPNYPQYFGTSFANLTTALPNTDGDFSDHSDASSFSGKKHHKHSGFGIKAKRSQSVMYDRMAYPPQYYPFGGFPPPHPVPGYGAAAPWGQSDHPIEAPPSPATSVRSFGRSHKSRHRKKKMVVSDNDDEDERLSVRSSPRSRTTSSSDRFRKRKTPKKFERSASPSSLTSSEEEEEEEDMLQKEDRLSPEVQAELSQGDGYQTKQEKKKISKQGKEATKSEQKTKQHGSKIKATSHQKLKTDEKNFSPKFKKKDKAPVSSCESMDVNEEQVGSQQKTEEDVRDQEDTEMREESDYHYEENENEDHMNEPNTECALSDDQWQCEHCTFINNSDHRICQVCCKTKPGSAPQSDPILLSVPEAHASSSTAASPDILTLNTTSESLTSDTAKEYLTPPAAAEDRSHSAASENEGQNFEKLNSDLEQAEKELSRGLMELMKLKEESDIASMQTINSSMPDNTSSAKEVIATQNNQLEAKTEVPNMEAILPQLTTKAELLSEQRHPDLNVTKTENFSSKSIGTDSMELDFPMHPVLVPQVTTATTETAVDFGLQVQGQMSPANSSSEIRSPAPSSQKELSGKPATRRDSSCQTYQDENISRVENEIPLLSHTDNMEFQYPFNRAESMKSPQLPPIAPPGYRGFSGRGQGLMHRSHSRSSLFGDRYGDARAAPPEFDNLGFGFGPSPMYRSLSRSSLTGDYSDPWMSDVRSLRRPDFYLSMEELVERRRLETKRAQGLELVRMIREAEQQGFTADDIHVALNNCGKQNPVDWLQTNWRGMVDTVVTLATNYGKDKHENDIGVLSENEARDALRMHKGNIWAAVTECVEGRQRKFLELKARGNFSTKEIVDALTQSEGNVELAYTRLSATTLKPFLMRIWGAGEGVENQDGAVCDPSDFLDPSSSGWPKNSTLRSGNAPYVDAEHCSDQEDWDDDEDVEDEVSWNEDEEDEMESPENFDIQPKAVNRDRRGFISNHIATPESDSEYCDAFDPVGDIRSATSSSPVDEIFFVSPDSEGESQKEKKKGISFLSRLAALRKTKKPQTDDITEKLDGQSIDPERCFDDVPEKNDQKETKIRSTDTNTPNSDTNKIYSPLNILKQTFSAIKDSVIGSNNKGEPKHSRSITEARTIIVHDRAGHEVLPSDENVTMKSYHPLKSDALYYSEQKFEDNQKATDSDAIQISGNSISKEKEPVYDKNEDLNSLNEVLPEVQVTASDSPKSSASRHPDNLPVKQENGENSQVGIDNAANVADVSHRTQKQNDLANSVSTEKDPVQNSTKLQSLKIVESSSESEKKPLVLQPLEPHPQEENPQPMDLIVDIKDSNSKMRQSSKTLEEGGKAPTQGTSAVTPEKVSDSAINLKVAPSELSLRKSLEETTSNEVSVVAEIKRNSDDPERNVSLPASRNTNEALLNGNVTNEVEKPQNTELIRKDEKKTKIKKVKEGLRLKLPNSEKTSNSEMPSNGQKDNFLARKDTSPSATVSLSQKKEISEKKSDTDLQETVSECLPTPANENTALQKPQETKDSLEEDRALKKSADNGISAKNVNERSKEICITGENSNTNISENEFHDMASKITEKMENCLEVLKSSEAVFTETQQNIASTSGKEQLLPMHHKAENKLDSVNQGSETAQGTVNNSTVNVPKTATESEKPETHDEKSKVPTQNKKPDDMNVQSSKSLNGNKESRVDSENILTDPIKESHALPDDGKSSESSNEQTVTNDLQQPSASSAPSKENKSGKFATTSFADKTSDKTNDPSKTTKEKSSESESTSFSPTSMNSESTSQAPVIHPGVKAKTFAGGNRKAKSQFTVTDTKQKDIQIRSDEVKPTNSLAQNKNIPDTKKDALDVKQETTEENDIGRDEKVTQPHQSETESHVNSITNSSKGNISSSVSNEQPFSTSPIENNIETPFAVQADDQKPSSSEHAAAKSDPVGKQSEENKPETPKVINSVVSENKSRTKFERVDSIERVKEPDTNIPSAATSSEELVVSSSKDSNGQAGEALHSSPAVSSSDESKDDQLNAETKEKTNSFPAKEDNASSSSIASGVRRPASRVEALKNSLNDGRETRSLSPIRPQSPFGRMTSLSARKEAIAQERSKDAGRSPTVEKKPWFIEKVQPPKPTVPKRSIKQQLEFERKIRKLVSERKCRTYRKAEIVVQLLELNFVEEEALHAAHECSTLEQAISYLQQECLLCTGMYPVGQIVSMIHCPHKACRECIKAYFTIQIRDRTIMELLCPFCNEPDISDEDVAQDYFNHLDILLKKLVETDIHELFQRKLRDRVLMKDPNFRWCSQCSSGFIAMPNLKRLICPDCNAITCASCRRPWQREHEGISCEAFAVWKDANDPEAHAAGLAKLLQEDGIDCPNCHFRYSLAKGGCMHFRCIQCQHDFCSGCSKPFKMGQKCGVSDFCGKLGLHAHHPRNCLFYLRDKDPEDLQRLLELNNIEYNKDKDQPEGMELKFVCQVMEQKETSDGLVDDICGKEVLQNQAGLCRVHYVEYLGQLVNKHKIDPIQIFCNDDLELVLRRASKRLPAKGYRDSEVKYREKLVQLIQEELPLEQTEGS